MKWLSNLNFNLVIKTEVLQLVYALLVIILVPAAFALNTTYILRSVERDMDFELNNKALLLAKAIEADLQNKLNDETILHAHINDLVKSISEIKAIELFRLNQDEIKPIVSTSETTKLVSDPILNQMAWGGNQAFSKQIIARVGSGNSERIWLVAMPLSEKGVKKVGLINIYISAAEIDRITKRTMQDSLIILVITMIFILLLLLNHFRFFETSLLFKKLNEVDKLKDDFISMASHELKAPLTVIMGYTSVITTNKIVEDNPELKNKVGVIEQSTLRLRSLVEDLLDVSRIEQNRMVFEFTITDIRKIMQEVVNEFKFIAQQKNLVLSYVPGDVPLNIYCDINKIKQIFVNLVSNAIKYTPAGQVDVFHEVVNGQIKTYVKDTGVGISDEDRSKLFGKFSRIYDEKTHDVPGSGLGLWIIKQLIEKMKGKISVESIKNQGTQFIVTFPPSKPAQ